MPADKREVGPALGVLGHHAVFASPGCSWRAAGLDDGREHTSLAVKVASLRALVAIRLQDTERAIPAESVQTTADLVPEGGYRMPRGTGSTILDDTAVPSQDATRGTDRGLLVLADPSIKHPVLTGGRALRDTRLAIELGTCGTLGLGGMNAVSALEDEGRLTRGRHDGDTQAS